MVTVELYRQQNGVHLLTISGELDLNEKERVLDALPSVATDGCRGLIVDLSNITLLTSAAIKVLAIFLNTLRQSGVPMVITASCQNYPVSLFRKIGAFDGTELMFFETQDEALAAIIERKMA